MSAPTAIKTTRTFLLEADEETYRPMFADLYRFMTRNCKDVIDFESVCNGIVQLSDKYKDSPSAKLMEQLVFEVVQELERLYAQGRKKEEATIA